MENQSTTPSMQFLLLEQVQFLAVKDDSLLQWELVNVVDAEEDGDEQGGDDGDSDTICDGFGSWNSPVSWSNASAIEGIRHLLVHPDADLEDREPYRFHGDEQADDDDGGEDEEEEDDDDEDDGYGLDDELVPWSVSNKFGRQRMRKLGKREFSKMHNSKRSPYLFVRPGCVHGKHGLGLKHNY